jgi:hypothetical protein
VVRSEGSGVEVDGGGTLRGRQGQGRWQWRTNGLRKKMAVARSEAGVEAAACSRAGIENDRWRHRHDSF